MALNTPLSGYTNVHFDGDLGELLGMFSAVNHEMSYDYPEFAEVSSKVEFFQLLRNDFDGEGETFAIYISNDIVEYCNWASHQRFFWDFADIKGFASLLENHSWGRYGNQNLDCRLLNRLGIKDVRVINRLSVVATSIDDWTDALAILNKLKKGDPFTGNSVRCDEAFVFNSTKEKSDVSLPADLAEAIENGIGIALKIQVSNGFLEFKENRIAFPAEAFPSATNFVGRYIVDDRLVVQPASLDEFHPSEYELYKKMKEKFSKSPSGSH